MTPDETPGRLSRPETKARTRQLLLDAAAREFARKGFAGASVNDIAKAAGFTIGALYAHFASKEQLFLELVTERSRSRLTQASAAVSTTVSDREALRSAMNELLVVAADDADLAPLQAEMWLYAIRHPDSLQQLAEQFRANRDELSAALVDRAQTHNHQTETDFDLVAVVLLALFQGLVQVRRTDPALVPEHLYGTAASWIFSGLPKAAGASSND